MDLKKCRDRTSEELLVKKNEFLKICDILDDLNINYFLQTGVLLGAIREKDFIKWDWGVDFSVFSNEFLDRIDPLTASLRKEGFEILSINKKKNDSKIYFRGKYPDNVTGYTVFAWNYSKLKDIYWRRDYSVPSKFLNKFSTIDFLGRKFKCPYNPEEYLSHAYGEWKKPIRTSDKNLYNADNYYSKKNSFFRNFKNNLKKKIYSIFKRQKI
jgi:lipopolysaccharide cholinephosphotransferase